MSKQEAPPTFEKAFHRLEEILEKLNSGAVSLDESLRLYEEANGLIIHCSQNLNQAEQRITMLMKNRQGELQLGADQRPQVQDFANGPTEE